MFFSCRNFAAEIRNNDTNMEIITMESEAYQALVLRIQRIEQFVVDATAEKGKPDDEVWLGTKEACRMMGVSERTMQQYRTDGTVAYKHCGKFCRYRLSDIKSLTYPSICSSDYTVTIQPSYPESVPVTTCPSDYLSQ